MMLAVRPDLVQMDKAENFAPRSIQIAEGLQVSAAGRAGRLRLADPGSSSIGRLRKPRWMRMRRQGALSVEYSARGLVTLLQEVHRYPLADVKFVPPVPAGPPYAPPSRTQEIG